MSYIVIKIGGKGFKSYYFPCANFLEKGNNLKVVALGKKVQMAAYLSSIIQKHGAKITDISISTVELPSSESTTNRSIDVVMIEIYIDKHHFKSQIQPDEVR